METQKKTIVITEVQNVHPILFLAFAEFLGYVTPLIDWVDAACKGENTSQPYQRKFLAIEAQEVYRRLQADYTQSELRQWYKEFYESLLYKYEAQLNAYDEFDQLPF